ncbi:MAG: 50S ribosomal protein L29 [Candidatus Omnitrophica bacterium]|nr:50S ribosomal protein L29 [Candidatus Omnitrophota bacterium]
MKPSEIRNMTDAEIEQNILEMKEKLFQLRAESSSGRIERPNRFRDLKKDIARCLTILKEKKGE